MEEPTGTGAAERRVFAAVVRAAMGEPASAEPLPTDALEPIAPFLTALPASDRRQLRALLLGLEYAAPLLTRRPGRFSRLPPERQAACLARLSASRFPVSRRAAAALKALAALARYGRDVAWPGVGYDGPWLGRINVPVLPAPAVRVRAAATPDFARAPGIALGRGAPGDVTLRADAVVIGLGAGGAAALARLAELGIDAVGIEAGGAPTAAEYTQRELDMLPLLYRDAGLRATSDQAISILQGRGVGGSTLHNTGLVYAPPQGVVARWRAEHGFALADGALARYVAGVLDTLGATPIPAERVNANNDALRRGAERLGWRHRVALHNRVECSGCGYCMIGCAYNRKNNAALTYVPRAVAAGARVLADAAAVRIEGGAGARRVVCELRDAVGRPTGRRAAVEAPVVLVAAGALDSPALLRRSGLGNAWVGRGLRLHPAATVVARFPEPVHAWRGLPQSVLIEEFASFLDDGRGGFLLLANPATGPALMATLVPGMGTAHRAVMRELPRLASAAVLLHDEGAGRVHAGRDGRPRVRYWPGAADRRTLLRGIHALARVYLAAGAERVYLPFADAPPVADEAGLDAALRRARLRRHALPLTSVHPQATCAIGAEPARGAVDPRGAVWGAPGIYVCDASLFPTSVGVPPQVTIMALATAVAEHAAESVR